MVNLTDTFTKTFGRPPTQSELGKLMKLQVEQEQRKKLQKPVNAAHEPPKKKAPTATRADALIALQTKVAKQKNEIARLTQRVEQLNKEKAKLLSDLKWIRGEKT
jgi:flagellar motility protein MotE (MotC chaperone)